MEDDLHAARRLADRFRISDVAIQELDPIEHCFQVGEGCRC